MIRLFVIALVGALALAVPAAAAVSDDGGPGEICATAPAVCSDLGPANPLPAKPSPNGPVAPAPRPVTPLVPPGAPPRSGPVGPPVVAMPDVPVRVVARELRTARTLRLYRLRLHHD